MIKSVCIIGFGSIGQKHYNILKELLDTKHIYIYSRRIKNKKNFINSKKKLKTINPDYFIIANETTLHLNFLKYIDSNFTNKIVLCEKPLYYKYFNFKFSNKNTFYVGYNLRFDKILIDLRKYIHNKKIINVKISCLSYLPNWRKRNYTLTSSANNKTGGGVLLDLSHEIDYSNLLFGPIKLVNYVYDKISPLKINVKDYFNGNFINNKQVPLSINLSYYSFNEERKISIYGNKFYIEADLIKRTLKIKNNNKIKKIKYKNINTYKEMHLEILKNYKTNICDFESGLNVLKIIQSIK